MATYANGDVQGCFEELRPLLGELNFDRGRDHLWFVGDLVNRGPESAATLRFVRALGACAVTVLGNHDLHLVAHVHGYARQRNDDTFGDVLEASDRDELVDWLRGLPLMHAEGGWVMVHAGLLPAWSVDKALALAREVQAALRGEHYLDFLAGLYGAKPDRWDDALEGMDRLRVIVNAMTRMRYCTAEGAMEFRNDGETAPRGFFPWFDAPGRASAPAALICGHWSARGLCLRPNLLALDSGCVWGGHLSAVRLEDRKLFQVPCRESRRPAAGA